MHKKKKAYTMHYHKRGVAFFPLIILMCQIYVHCEINMNSNILEIRNIVTQRRHGNADNQQSTWKCNTHTTKEDVR